MNISKQEQLLEIKDSMKELTENSSNLQLHLHQLEQKIEIESPSETFVKGDTLQTMNNYHGLRRTQGKIIYTTVKQCTIRDSSKKTHTRNCTNVKLVHHAIQK